MPRRLLLAALLLVLPAAQAQDMYGDDADPTAMAQAAAHRAYSARFVDALAATGGARELALAALMRTMASTPDGAMPQGDRPSQRVPHDPQAQAWLQRAASKAGDDIVANQLLVLAAKTGDAALRTEAVRSWRAADPGNLIPLLHAGLTTEALLAEARGATDADTHMYESVRWIASAYRRHPPTAAEQAALSAGEAFHADEAGAIAAMGLWAAVAMPGYATLVEGCRGDMLRALPARRGDCHHVATLLADHAGSVADEQLGLGLLRALAQTPAERAQVEARLRDMDWRMLQWGRAAQQQPRDGAEQFARLLADPSITTEQQLLARVLQEAGIALQPPADWTPPRR